MSYRVGRGTVKREKEGVVADGDQCSSTIVTVKD